MRLRDLIEDSSFWFGLALALFGAVLAFFSYFIAFNIPLTALGLASIILGLSIALTPSSPVPKLAVKAILEGAWLNLEALLEEFNVEGRAVYMPPRDDRVYVFIPQSSNPTAADAEEAAKAPMRVLTSVKGKLGLMVFPPCSEIVKLAAVTRGLSVEEAVSLALVQFLEGADSVKAVREANKIIVEIANPVVEIDLPRVKRSLGSSSVSLAGCALAQSLGRPVIFIRETAEGKRLKAEFEAA